MWKVEGWLLEDARGEDCDDEGVLFLIWFQTNSSSEMSSCPSLCQRRKEVLLEKPLYIYVGGAAQRE